MSLEPTSEQKDKTIEELVFLSSKEPTENLEKWQQKLYSLLEDNTKDRSRFGVTQQKNFLQTNNLDYLI